MKEPTVIVTARIPQSLAQRIAWVEPNTSAAILRALILIYGAPSGPAQGVEK